MPITNLKLEKEDGRGEMWSFKINGTEFVVSVTNKGMHRAGHAHLGEEAPHYVIHGKSILKTELNNIQKERTIESRQTYISTPGEFHLFEAMEDCVIMEEGGHKNNMNHSEWRKIVERDAARPVREKVQS